MDVSTATNSAANRSRVRSPGFRPDIEGLRALAVALVVAFHLGLKVLPGGFIGVDIFFVISGYLITGLLVKEIETTGGLDLLSFYGRRARRLLPTSIVVLAVTLLIGSLILAPRELASTAKSGIASALYSSNFWFIYQARDYFAPESAMNPFLHTWSLGVEEQFYFIWPMLLLLLARRSPMTAIIGLSVAIVASLAFCLHVVHINQAVAFYASPTRVWEFGIGALGTFVPEGFLRRHAKVFFAIAWVGLASVIASALIITERTVFPGAWAIVPVVGTAAMLIAGKATEGKALAFLGARSVQYIGRQSYALYLWHWPVIVYGLIIWPSMGVAGRIACLLMTLALSALSFRWVESPVRASKLLSAHKRLTVAVALLLTVVGASLGLGAGHIADHLEMQPEQAEVTRAQTEISALAKTDCLIALAQKTAKDCRFGNPNAAVHVVLFGDSHAAQWFTPIEKIAQDNHAELITLLKSSCAAADVQVMSSRLRRQFHECDEWRHAAIQKIIDLRPNVVILSEHSLSYVRQDGVTRTAQSVSAEEWSRGLQRTLAVFKQAGIPTIVIADTPEMGHDVPTCLGRALRIAMPAADCGRVREHALNAEVTQGEQRAAAAVGDILYIDVNDLLCPGSTCFPRRNGAILFRDANHITENVAVASSLILKERMSLKLGTLLALGVGNDSH